MTSIDYLKSITKNIFIVTFVLGIFLYLWYFGPKKNALNTVSEFKEICEKNNGKLVYEFKLE
jgi:regulatory protein YycI of two-component signal transduction system YycFG